MDTLLLDGMGLRQCSPASYLKPVEPARRLMERTLIIVTHSATDQEYAANLEFLIKHGMGGQDQSLQEYIVVVQQAGLLSTLAPPP